MKKEPRATTIWKNAKCPISEMGKEKTASHTGQLEAAGGLMSIHKPTTKKKKTEKLGRGIDGSPKLPTIPKKNQRRSN